MVLRRKRKVENLNFWHRWPKILKQCHYPKSRTGRVQRFLTAVWLIFLLQGQKINQLLTCQLGIHLTGHDCNVFGQGICRRLFDGIANEPFPRTSEVFCPNKQEAESSVRGRTQILKNVLQWDEHLPSTSWPLQHAICPSLCPGFV